MKLSNSRPVHPAGARKLRSVPASDEIITVTILVRSAESGTARQNAIQQLGVLRPHQRLHLDSEEFSKRHGARFRDLELIEKFAKEHRLSVVEKSREKRCVVLTGTIRAFSQAFRVKLAMHRHEGLTYRSHEDAISVPAELSDIVQAVLGLDNRALMMHHAFARVTPAQRHTNPEEVAKAYDFPLKTDGRGQRIAIVELGGGFYDSDLEHYFQKLKLKLPNISTIELDGQKNDPASVELIKKILDAMGMTPDESKRTTIGSSDLTKALWTIEATLDIELAGSFANEADIVVYFAPNNAQGKYNGLTSALHSKQHPPTIISCSWGAVEENLSPDFMHSMDQVFQDAALKGITICFSSGDKGEDPGKNGSPRVHFPASSPYVLSCGGTHWLNTDQPLKEVVWSEQMPTYLAQTGGGVSKFFDIPSWQSGAGIESKTSEKGRGVPDVAGKADMVNGYGMIVGGYSVTMGGTSSAVPMWAGLIARLNQELGKNIGFLNPLLYQENSTLTDITEGNTGANYKAAPGWDPCTGLGTPLGAKLLAALRR